MPSRWQPVLFNGYPEFDSLEQANDMIQLLGRFYNQIKDNFRKHQIFKPFIFFEEKAIDYKSASLECVSQWCQGYLQGAKLDAEWMSNEFNVVNLFPFRVLAGKINIIGEKSSEGKIIEDDAYYKAIYREELPVYIQNFYEKWAKQPKLPLWKTGNQLEKALLR